jgi:hypothetical protein
MAVAELARKRAADPMGGGPAVLPPLRMGDVMGLVVRRGRVNLHLDELETARLDDYDGAYTEELICAWELIWTVAQEVCQGKRNLGGERRR